ncbi:hypothetical protein C8R45DRAFT_1039757, partial [Mycena sanguinolenta]
MVLLYACALRFIVLDATPLRAGISIATPDLKTTLSSPSGPQCGESVIILSAPPPTRRILCWMGLAVSRERSDSERSSRGTQGPIRPDSHSSLRLLRLFLFVLRPRFSSAGHLTFAVGDAAHATCTYVSD